MALWAEGTTGLCRRAMHHAVPCCAVPSAGTAGASGAACPRGWCFLSIKENVFLFPGCGQGRLRGRAAASGSGPLSCI